MSEHYKSPPKIAKWSISRLKRYQNEFSMIGDIEEIYFNIYDSKGFLSAYLWYWMQTVSAFPKYLSNTFYWGFCMFKNYLKITIRTLLKYKGFSIINIAGLAVSMAICLMIILFIKDEKSSDTFHEKKDRITRVYTTDSEIRYSEVKGWATSPAPLAQMLVNDYAGVEDAVRLKIMRGNVIHNETAVSFSGLYAEPSFFNIFTYNFLKGDPATALNDPYSVVITEKTAVKYFGSGDPLNKTLTLETLGDFKVTGVLQDTHLKSHFVFDIIASFSTINNLISRKIMENNLDNWKSYHSNFTYLLLNNKSSGKQLEPQLPDLINKIFPENEQKRFGFKLQPLLKINLGVNLINFMPGTKHSFEIVFIPFIAVIIVFLACFNYINLSIARSLKRTKEIGLRKVVGAGRGQIIRLFLSEAFVITFFALIVACILILWLVPLFNTMNFVEYAQSQINLSLLKDFDIYAVFLLFAFGVSVLAGIYPAMYLSSFLPVNALKGVSKVRGVSRLLTRKILVVLQFTVSIVAIITIIFIYHQQKFMMSFDKGINTENMVNVKLFDVDYDLFRNEVINNSIITGISATSNIPVHGSWV